MRNRTCAAIGCTERHHARGYCRRHYDVLRWHSALRRINRSTYEMGQRFGTVTLLYPAGPKDGTWLCECDCGNAAHLRPRNLRAQGVKATCGDGDNHPGRGRNLSDPGYVGTHERLRRRRGKAKSRLCTLCGARAYSWGYSNAAPSERERWGKGERGEVMAYTDLTDHYMPLCASCHKRWDLATAREQGKPVNLFAVALQAITNDGDHGLLSAPAKRGRKVATAA